MKIRAGGHERIPPQCGLLERIDLGDFLWYELEETKSSIDRPAINSVTDISYRLNSIRPPLIYAIAIFATDWPPKVQQEGAMTKPLIVDLLRGRAVHFLNSLNRNYPRKKFLRPSSWKSSRKRFLSILLWLSEGKRILFSSPIDLDRSHCSIYYSDLRQMLIDRSNKWKYYHNKWKEQTEPTQLVLISLWMSRRYQEISERICRGTKNKFRAKENLLTTIRCRLERSSSKRLVESALSLKLVPGDSFLNDTWKS